MYLRGNFIYNKISMIWFGIGNVVVYVVIESFMEYWVYFGNEY